MKRIGDARIECGYTIKVAAEYANISMESLEKYELNVDQMPLGVALKLIRMYQVHIDAICFS